MNQDFCPSCKERQWSGMDKAYCILYETCWSEDKERWEKGELNLSEFEERERLALDYAVNKLNQN